MSYTLYSCTIQKPYRRGGLVPKLQMNQRALRRGKGLVNWWWQHSNLACLNPKPIFIITMLQLEGQGYSGAANLGKSLPDLGSSASGWSPNAFFWYSRLSMTQVQHFFAFPFPEQVLSSWFHIWYRGSCPPSVPTWKPPGFPRMVRGLLGPHSSLCFWLCGNICLLTYDPLPARTTWGQDHICFARCHVPTMFNAGNVPKTGRSCAWLLPSGFTGTRTVSACGSPGQLHLLINPLDNHQLFSMYQALC